MLVNVKCFHKYFKMFRKIFENYKDIELFFQNKKRYFLIFSTCTRQNRTYFTENRKFGEKEVRL